MADSRTDWWRVGFGVLLGVLAAYQQFKLPPAMPLLIAAYDYSRLLAGGFMSVYAITGLLFSVWIGRALVRRGPRLLLSGAFAVLMLGNALALAVPQVGLAMLLSRLLEGIGFAVLAVVGAVIATTSAVGRDKLLAVALWTTWIPLGQVISSLLGFPLVAAELWRPLWWLAMLATGGVAVWGWRLGIGAEPRSDPAPAPGGQGPGAAVEVRRRGLLVLAAGLFTLWTTQFLAFASWLPQYLVEVRGVAPGVAALIYLVPPVLIVVFNLLTGGALRAGAPLGLLLGGSIAVQAAVWWLIPVTDTGAAGVLSLVAYGITTGITPTCLFALPNAILGPGAAASHGFAAIMTGRNLGALIGPVLLAQAVALAGDWNVVAPVFGSLCVAAVAVATHLAVRLGRLRTEAAR